ncbi:hypothetical protein GX865_04220 [Candidatus Saccharibacteria bacterium]|jgi:hypothetical protein|nr:hypothetical protein [Candidatus Saccharibacteria bacterium]
MKRLTTLIIGLSLLLSIFAPSTIMAVDVLESACGQTGQKNAVCDASSDDVNGLIKNITNTMLFLLGATAVIAIIIGGFMYVTAAGDAGKVKTAKNTVMYAVIGLIVALLAWGIVSFTVTQVQTV